MPDPVHYATPIVNGEAVDEIPPEEDLSEPRIAWVKKAEFRGSVSGANIDKEGVLSLTVKVPFEDKYLALPVTDIRSVMMVFAVFQPVQDDGD